jgi:cytochrome c oxidase cbb3-type subunit 4
MDITFLRIVATLACFFIFLGIALWAFAGRNRDRFMRDAQIPFEQD